MKREQEIRNRGLRRRGTVIPLVAVSMTVLLGFVALAVDVGYMYTTASETQRTADASALGGAAALHGKKNEVPLINQAIAVAKDVMDMNLVAREQLSTDATVVVGHWNGQTETFSTSVYGRTIVPNAVWVIAPRNELDLYFASIMGVETTDVTREAIAVSSSGRCLGIWGIEGVRTNGGIVTDSYIDTEGSYGHGPVYANGDLCSCQDVRVSGNFAINGDAMYGVSYDFIQDGGSGTVYGSIDDISCKTPTTEADFEWAMLNNDNASIGLTSDGTSPFRNGNGWNLWLVNDESITLAGGTYYFDSAWLGGQATIYVTGPTTIYVVGNGTFTGGGIVNMTGDPSNLLIYSQGSSLSLKGSSGFYGAVYAPETAVLITGTPDFYGSAVGLTVDIQGDTRIHVEETLVRDLFGVDPVAPILVK